MKDKLIEKIFKESEKSDFVDFVAEKMKISSRAIVCFEIDTPDKKASDFHYCQIGFKQTYEVLGFMQWLEEIIIENSTETETI